MDSTLKKGCCGLKVRFPVKSRLIFAEVPGALPRNVSHMRSKIREIKEVYGLNSDFFQSSLSGSMRLI
ncbi:hypothetical protein DLM75_16985 [Leptospira stimsonii]|uniref:Uncharacterized protein n=1 Tax=Leptospira stimsonii TaxID=2202203 RepID=A0A396YZA8_9LEPT|nr:hypothetical protein DLM75_16985 [Leptospira stimsonii]